MKAYFAIMLILLLFTSCHTQTPHSEKRADEYVVKNLEFSFNNFHFLDSIKTNKIIAIWLDKNHLYDTMFNKSNLPIDTIRSEVIRIDTFEAKAGKCISVLIATRTLGWDCHPCGPLMEIYLFSLSDSGKTDFIKRTITTRMGCFGDAPQVSFKKIGGLKWGYLFEPGFMNNGIMVSSLYLYEITNEMNAMPIFEIVEASNTNVGMYPEDSPRFYEYSTKLEFLEWESSYRRIMATKKGTNLVDNKIINIDSTFYYKYQNQRYELIKSEVNEKNTGSK